VPGYVEVERLLKEARKIAEKKGLKEGKRIGIEKGIEKGRRETYKEVAKTMKNSGVDIASIKKFTSLSKEEIEKL
jgi:predicted transposase/invertase (TIGR01784 family)